MALRDLDIDIDLDIDSSGLATVNADINELIARVNAIQDNINININADTALTEAQLAQLQETLDQLDANNPTIDVDAQATEALAELTRLEQMVHDLDHDDIFFGVDVEDASGEILRLRTLIRTLERDINLNVDTTGAHAQLAMLQAHMATLRASGGGGGPPIPDIPSAMGSFNWGGLIMASAKIIGLISAIPLVIGLMNVLIGVVGTLGVALGVVAGGLLAFVSAIGVAAVGLGGFAVLAIGAITDLYDEDVKLTSAQKELKKQTDGVADSWNGLKKAIEPITFSAITNGVASVNQLLVYGYPILTNAAKAADTMFASFGQSLKSDRMVEFFSYLERAVGPLSTNIGNGLGYALQGVANTMAALEPLTSWVAQGFENMMGRFADWTAGLQGSDKMTAFIDYVQANLPKIGDIFSGATDGVVGFFAAFDVTASDGLSWMAEKMKEFATWAGNLDSNQGFQDMLDRIKADGPIIAGIIGDIAGNIMELTGAMSDSGFLSWLGKVTSGDALLPKLNGFSFFKNLFGGDEPKIDVEVGADTSDLEAHLRSLSKTDVIEYAVEADIGIAEKEIGRLTKNEIIELIVNADTAQVEQQLTTLEQERLIEAVVNGDTTELINQINAITGADNSVDVKVNADITQAVADIEGLFLKPLPLTTDPLTLTNSITNLPALRLPAELDTSSLTTSVATMPTPEISVKASQIEMPAEVQTAEVTLKATDVDMPKDLPTVEVTAIVNQLDTSKVGPLSLDIDVSKANPLANFTWPPLPQWTWPPIPKMESSIIKFDWPEIPKFTFPPLPVFTWPPMPTFTWPALPKFEWPALPKWVWPSLPKFSWPAYPKFTWPPMPTVKVSVSGAAGGGGKLPGFSSGLGRVQQDMDATIHKGEAVLPAHQAETLRNMGVIQGDGRYPTLDTSPLATMSYEPVSVSNMGDSSTVTRNDNSSKNITISPSISITVQGGNTNNETASSIKDKLSEWVESMGDVLSAELEW